MIKYISPNGYTGILYGESSLSIYDSDDQNIFHTGSRNINTLEELKYLVEAFPKYRSELAKHWKELMEDDDDDYEI